MNPAPDVIGHILREAFEAGGIVGWATVDDWDGVAAGRITERGGTVHVLDESVIRRGIAALLDADDLAQVDVDALTSGDSARVDGSLADAVVQAGLFGSVVYH